MKWVSFGAVIFATKIKSYSGIKKKKCTFVADKKGNNGRT
jgi:hypothetical protein